MESLPGLIIGHSNTDLDCLGSIVIAKKLFPDFIAVHAQRMHPLAAKLLNLYGDRLGIQDQAAYAGKSFDALVVVDTHKSELIKEFCERLGGQCTSTRIFDHHVDEEGTSRLEPEIAAKLGKVDYVCRPVGANTSLLCHIAEARGLHLDEIEATVALAGIYGDTGNFSHANVGQEDFQAAKWLVSQGANINLVIKLLGSSFDSESNAILHEMIGQAKHEVINGQEVILAQVVLEKQKPGLAILVERIFELEKPDVFIAIFSQKKECSQLVVGRSASPELDIAHVLALFGGGGHAQSASALLKRCDDIPVLDLVRSALRQRLAKAVCASDFMTHEVELIGDHATLLEAALFLESANHESAPVVNAAQKLVGIISFTEIQKGRKAGTMNAPVSAYMLRNPATISPDTSFREIEQLLFKSELGRFPVVRDERVVGYLSRNDYLRFVQK